MGQAEQRQVRTGVADRVKREEERTEIERGRLWEIRRFSQELSEREARVRGAQAGLRGAVGMAILNPGAPSDEAVAQAAGWTVEQVEQYRQDVLHRPDLQP